MWFGVFAILIAMSSCAFPGESVIRLSFDARNPTWTRDLPVGAVVLSPEAPADPIRLAEAYRDALGTTATLEPTLSGSALTIVSVGPLLASVDHVDVSAVERQGNRLLLHVTYTDAQREGKDLLRNVPYRPLVHVPVGNLSPGAYELEVIWETKSGAKDTKEIRRKFTLTP